MAVSERSDAVALFVLLPAARVDVVPPCSYKPRKCESLMCYNNMGFNITSMGRRLIYGKIFGVQLS